MEWLPKPTGSIEQISEASAVLMGMSIHSIVLAKPHLYAISDSIVSSDQTSLAKGRAAFEGMFSVVKPPPTEGRTRGKGSGILRDNGYETSTHTVSIAGRGWEIITNTAFALNPILRDVGHISFRAAAQIAFTMELEKLAPPPDHRLFIGSLVSATACRNNAKDELSITHDMFSKAILSVSKL